MEIKYFKHKKEKEIMKSYTEFMNEKFNFKGAVKTGMLDKYDEKYVKDLKKKGWEIDEFNLTSDGYEIFIIKNGKREKYIDKKTPSRALKLASEKAK